jgi:predicted nucleotidyltransferase
MIENFLNSLKDIPDEGALLDFCRKHSLHGTPRIFDGAEDKYYDFRKRIAEKFSINFHEVFITGSAKLGFSPHKKKMFDYDSDVDVAIVSADLYERIMSTIHEYQMELRENRKAVSENEIRRYHKFLEYGAIGWMRPDLLPTSFRMKELKRDWFDFFDSRSYGKSEVGNYKVAAGVFKTYKHLEKYTVSGLRSLKMKTEIGAVNVTAD